MSRKPPSKLFPFGLAKFDTAGMLAVSAILVMGSIGIGLHSYHVRRPSLRSLSLVILLLTSSSPFDRVVASLHPPSPRLQHPLPPPSPPHLPPFPRRTLPLGSRRRRSWDSGPQRCLDGVVERGGEGMAV